MLTYDDQGNVKAVLIYGCAVLTAKKKTNGEIAIEQSTLGKTDPAAGGVLRHCFGPGATTTPNPTPAGGGGGGLFGLGTAATVAIIAGIDAVALLPLAFQDNPSGTNP